MNKKEEAKDKSEIIDLEYGKNLASFVLVCPQVCYCWC